MRCVFTHRSDWREAVAARLDPFAHQGEFHEVEDVDFDKIDAFVPLAVSDYQKLREIPEAEGKCLIPNAEVVALFDDKKAFHDYFEATELSGYVPRILRETEIEYPHVYKKSQDEFGKNTILVHTPAEDPDPANAEPGFFRQHYVSGAEEYVTHFLCVNGEVRFSRTFRYEMGRGLFYVKNAHNAARRTIAVPTPRFEPVLRRFVEIPRYTGTCCLNFKLEDGRPQVFEINPRYGASLKFELNPYLDAYSACLGVQPRPLSPTIRAASQAWRASFAVADAVKNGWRPLMGRGLQR